jgi:hypothetical protein
MWRATMLTRYAVIIVAINLRLWGWLLCWVNLSNMIDRIRKVSWSWAHGNSNKVGYLYRRRPRRLRIKMFTGLDEIGRSMNLVASTVQVDKIFDVFFGFVLVKCRPDSLTRLKEKRERSTKTNSKRKHVGAPDHRGHISSIQG